ncbi:hypothetical protein SAMN05216169_103417 [Anoxybacillus pushchinoensis]|jgi:hypothetical protein|uniref:Uncharacterized protein n=1 Tax=Anoxybacillus pushchinoensis TaxID=150248 RepID=A0A1I0TMJ8_9BACL|nr:hypothetical protein SAMN05216169_103417 [Anoxybacillus pushchinoensis]
MTYRLCGDGGRLGRLVYIDEIGRLFRAVA